MKWRNDVKKSIKTTILKSSHKRMLQCSPATYKREVTPIRLKCSPAKYKRDATPIRLQCSPAKYKMEVTPIRLQCCRAKYKREDLQDLNIR
jgi:hypothetical protein